MKRIFLLFLLVIALFVFFWKYNQNFLSPSEIASPQSPSSPITSPTIINPSNVINLIYNQKNYALYFQKISEKQIKIIPNFEENDSSLSLVEKNNCQTAFNGGFYTKNNKPLGLFVADGVKLGEKSEDKTLLTGFFYLDENNAPHISNFEPSTSNVFQSGPFLFNDKPLKTTSDEQARRIVVVETTDKELYAVAVVFQDSQFTGPLLSELPPIIFSIKAPFVVKQALNLDGGAASFFFEENGLYLREQTNVGSVVCIK